MQHDIRLFVHCKDTNLKAIHNLSLLIRLASSLFVHCKDTNLKAIHNVLAEPNPISCVVRALQRY